MYGYFETPSHGIFLANTIENYIDGGLEGEVNESCYHINHSTTIEFHNKLTIKIFHKQ